jgi:hypothetical protein
VSTYPSITAKEKIAERPAEQAHAAGEGLRRADADRPRVGFPVLAEPTGRRAPGDISPTGGLMPDPAPDAGRGSVY